MSLSSTIDINNHDENMMKDIELVREKARTKWILIINLPLPFGATKSQAIQNLFSKVGYGKLVFDAERDLLATDLLYVNRTGLLYNISMFLTSDITSTRYQLPSVIAAAVAAAVSAIDAYCRCCSMKQRMVTTTESRSGEVHEFGPLLCDFF